MTITITITIKSDQDNLAADDVAELWHLSEAFTKSLRKFGDTGMALSNDLWRDRTQ